MLFFLFFIAFHHIVKSIDLFLIITGDYMSQYPLLIEPLMLEQNLDDENILIIDLCKKETYSLHHIPGAIHLDYSHIIKVDKPVVGKVPVDERLIEIFSSLGIGKQTHVVAYDDEGGGKACRFMWTLELMGHTKLSLLNGGIFSWANSGLPLSQQIELPTTVAFEMNKDLTPLATLEYIQENLRNDQVQLLDSRSMAEYRGTEVFANKGGHIPGAIHYEWTDAMDKNNNLCMLSIAEIEKTLKDKGFDKGKMIIAYCHSHHRSSYSYYVLKIAGYKHIKGYAGSWSEWGNHPDTEADI